LINALQHEMSHKKLL